MIHYDEYGNRENPTLLMLHGAGAVHTFAHQYSFQDKYHLIVPHLFGNGLETDQPYEPEAVVSALVELIESLGEEKIHIMGHSMGGELAVALVAKYPDYFDKAVFMSPWVCSTEKSVANYVKMAKFSAFTLKFRFLLKWQAKYWHYNEEQTEFLVTYGPKITKENYIAFFANRVKLNDLEGYPDVKIPMLAICGNNETLEMKISIEELGKRNPMCKTMILPGVTHDFPLRNPDDINPILLEFFGG